jgi:LemA protein
VVFYLIYQYNLIVQAKNNVKEMYASIDVSLKNRYDLLPNLIETIKWYMKHEADILIRTTKQRNLTRETLSQEILENEVDLSTQVKSIFAVAESYPELQASKNFLQLQHKLTELENTLQAVRRAYNASVKELHVFQEQIPTNIIAKLIHIPPYPYFEIINEEKKTITIAVK